MTHQRILPFVIGLFMAAAVLAARATSPGCAIDWSSADSMLSMQKPPALRSSFYQWLDPILSCGIQGRLSSSDEARLKTELERISQEFPTPAFLAVGPDTLVRLEQPQDAFGARISGDWRELLGAELSQLNSGVVAYVISDEAASAGQREVHQTTHNFLHAVKNPVFSPWIRKLEGDTDPYESLIAQSTSGGLSKPESNFSFTITSRDISRVGVSSPRCYYYPRISTVKCERDVAGTIHHEILHLLSSRYPRTADTLLRLEGGYFDRLNQAQTLVPGFMQSRCAPDAPEEFCAQTGPITQEEAAVIVKAVRPPQAFGSMTEKFIAWPAHTESERCSSSQERLVHQGRTYCVEKSESLYAFVRGGSEYLASLYELFSADPEQYERVVSPAEREAYSRLHSFLFH